MKRNSRKRNDIKGRPGKMVPDRVQRGLKEESTASWSAVVTHSRIDVGHPGYHLFTLRDYDSQFILDFALAPSPSVDDVMAMLESVITARGRPRFLSLDTEVMPSADALIEWCTTRGIEVRFPSIARPGTAGDGVRQ